MELATGRLAHAFLLQLGSGAFWRTRGIDLGDSLTHSGSAGAVGCGGRECRIEAQGAVPGRSLFAPAVWRKRESPIDEGHAFELELSLGLGSSEIFMLRVVEAVPVLVAVKEVDAGVVLILRERKSRGIELAGLSRRGLSGWRR
jgi:hypothetical protein